MGDFSTAYCLAVDLSCDGQKFEPKLTLSSLLLDWKAFSCVLCERKSWNFPGDTREVRRKDSASLLKTCLLDCREEPRRSFYVAFLMNK